MKKNILIIAPIDLPVPATKGGAIESINELLVNQIGLSVSSSYEELAFKKTLNLQNTHFNWIKRNWLYQIINFFMRVIKQVFKNLDYLGGEIIKYHIKNHKLDFEVVYVNVNILKCASKAIEKVYVHYNLFGNPDDKTQLSFAKLPSRLICVSDFVKNLSESLGLLLDDMSLRLEMCKKAYVNSNRFIRIFLKTYASILTNS